MIDVYTEVRIMEEIPSSNAYMRHLFEGGANIEGPLLRKLLSKRIQILPSTLKSRDKEVCR